MKIRATYQFFLYTLAGSHVMLKLLVILVIPASFHPAHASPSPAQLLSHHRNNEVAQPQNVRAVHMHSYNILPGGPCSPAPHRQKQTRYIFTERTFCWHIMNGGPLWSAMSAATKERSAEGIVVGICTSPRWGYSRMQGKMRKLGPKPLYHRAIKSAFA